MFSALETKDRALSQELTRITDPQQRLAHVVERGRNSQALPLGSKTDANLVPGCLSKLWLVAEGRDGLCWFRSDSESAIVKGVASLLCEFYSGHTPGEILQAEPTFLSQAGITQHLSANRRNGLARIRGLIREFAERERKP